MAANLELVSAKFKKLGLRTLVEVDTDSCLDSCFSSDDADDEAAGAYCREGGDYGPVGEQSDNEAMHNGWVCSAATRRACNVHGHECRRHIRDQDHRTEADRRWDQIANSRPPENDLPFGTTWLNQDARVAYGDAAWRKETFRDSRGGS